MLDIGTSGYKHSRIRCNAELNGYTGYAELKAYSSYGMHLNLSTTRTDGGWMYFKINNDGYTQLSGSDRKLNVYKYISININLDVSVSNARTSINAYNTMEGFTSHIELEAQWNSQGYLNFESNKPGAHYLFLTVKGDLHMYCGNNLVHMYKDTTADGNLDVGQSQAQTSIKAYVNHLGYQGNIQIEPRWRSQGFIHFSTNYPEGLLLFAGKDDLYMYVGVEVIYSYEPTTNASDDRLKENEELIEHACETFSK